MTEIKLMVAWGWIGVRVTCVNGGITKGLEETFEGDEYVHFLDCNDDFQGSYMSKLAKLYN